MFKYLTDVRTRLNNPTPENLSKVLMICKICGLICCLALTVVLAFLPSNFLYCCLIAYALPGFVCGYIVINLVGAIVNYSQVDLITDIFFSICGICANLYISIDVLVNWVLWYSHEKPAITHISHYGTEFLILSSICLLNVLTMTVQLIYCCHASYKQFFA